MIPAFRFRAFAFALGASLAAAPSLPAAPAHAPRPVLSDLTPSEKRQATLDLAARLARPGDPRPAPTNLKTPFDFDRADPEPAAAGAPAPAARSTRLILETLAAKMPAPGGMMVFQGIPRLQLGSKLYKVGEKFFVTFDGSDYELELTAVDANSFTLRYKDQEITRLIKPGK